MPFAVTHVKQTRGPSEKDWIAIRPTFQRLYLHENRTLDTVRVILLREFEFRTTEKTCKTHIRRWGFDKKNKERDMRAVIRLARKRKAAGKDTLFTVRGRPLELGTAIEYFLRKGIDPHAIVDAADGPPSDVLCLTPKQSTRSLPTTPHDLPDLHSLQSVLINTPRAVDAFMAHAASKSGVIVPIRRYHDATGAVIAWWDMPRDSLCSGDQRPFDFETVDQACQLAYVELREQNICVVLDVMSALWSVATWEYAKLLQHFLAYIHQMANILLGPKHPFVEIFGGLVRLKRMLEESTGLGMENVIMGLRGEVRRVPELIQG